MTLQSGSLIGLHVIHSSHEVEMWIQNCVEAGAPLAVVKALSDADLLKFVKQVSPTTATVFRRVGERDNPGDQYLGQWGNSAFRHTEAEKQIAWHLERLTPEQRRATDYIGIINEPSPPTKEGWVNMTLFVMECMEQAALLGLKLSGPSFNFGMPEYDIMLAIIDTGFFEVAKRLGGILDVHEGVQDRQIMGPVSTIVDGHVLVVTQGWNDSIPGAPRVGGAGSTCFRYRWFADALARLGKPMIPVLVSEMYPGTRDPIKARKSLAWYEQEMAKDDYAIGVTPFTVNPTDDWKDFDLTDAYRREVINYHISQRGRKNVTTMPDDINIGQIMAEIESNRQAVILDVTEAFNKVIDHAKKIGELSEKLRQLSSPSSRPAWYTVIPIGTHLRVVRATGLDVYIDSSLTTAWPFGRKPFDDQGMTVHAAWDPAHPLALCVLVPTPPRYATGLWIAHTGYDGVSNVELI